MPGIRWHKHNVPSICDPPQQRTACCTPCQTHDADTIAFNFIYAFIPGPVLSDLQAIRMTYTVGQAAGGEPSRLALGGLLVLLDESGPPL